MTQLEKDLIQVRNYFGEHDKTCFEHFAFGVINSAMAHIKQQEDRIGNLQMDCMTHEYNAAEAERTWPQFKEQIIEPYKDALQWAEVELRAIYPRLGIKTSNVMRKIQEVLNSEQNAQVSDTTKAQ